MTSTHTDGSARTAPTIAPDVGADPPLLLTFAETGRLLRQSRSAVYALVRAKRLPVVHIGRSARIPRQAVERLVDELTTEAAGRGSRSQGPMAEEGTPREVETEPGRDERRSHPQVREIKQ